MYSHSPLFHIFSVDELLIQVNKGGAGQLNGPAPAIPRYDINFCYVPK